MKARCPTVAAMAAVTIATTSCASQRSAKDVDSSLFCQDLPETEGTGGKRDADEIKKRIREHDDAFATCYRGALERNPEAAGRLVTRLVIDADGTVSSACFEEATLEDDEAVECIRDELLDVRFPSADGNVTIVYPIEYSPG